MIAAKLVQPLLVLVVLGIGGGTYAVFRSTKPEAERVERVDEGLLVEVRQVHSATREVKVLAHGTVIPARRVVVQPELSGRVVWKNPELVAGGKLKKGAPLVRIDARDYQLQLEARKAEVSRAELELQLEQSRQQVARREWELFETKDKKPKNQGTKPNQSPTGNQQGDPQQGDSEEEGLALRGPQLRTAQVGVQSAASALDRAKLDLSRTSISAPFNALVIDEQVDVGQLVNTQAQLATLVGTDKYRVQVSIPVEALSHIAVPGTRGATEGSLARVYQQVGEERVERTGHVHRLLPDLDSGGAMARLLIEIDDPLGLELEGQPLPVLLNSYVNVEVAATTLENVIELPRSALREGDSAFVVDDEGKLRIRKLNIAWRYPQTVLVRDGLRDGEEIVVSRIATPVDGMPVRKSAANAQTEPKAPAPTATTSAAQPAPAEMGHHGAGDKAPGPPATAEAPDGEKTAAQPKAKNP